MELSKNLYASHVTELSRVQVLETVSCVKNRVRLHTIHQKWWDPFPDPAYAGALVHRVALLSKNLYALTS